MSKKLLIFGKNGENYAAGLLKAKGYKILVKNYRCPFGEIDIIARDKNTLCFIEVKSRSSWEFGRPQEALTRAKQKHISRAALCYLKENKLLDREARFDVVSITYSNNKPVLQLLKNAFELEAGYTY